MNNDGLNVKITENRLKNGGVNQEFDLVSRKALLDMIDKEILGTSDCILQNRLLGIGAYVLSMPTVDNVPVVRCKDCKHWNSDTGWCQQHSHFWDEHNKFCYPWESNEWKMFNEDDYCSDGERRE